MSERLSFPGLGLDFELSRVAFTAFGIPLYWYGVIIALGCFAGSCYVILRAKEFGLDGDRIMDVLIGAIIMGIIGARLYYVVFSWDEFADNLANIFNIRQGGIAIYGGIIGGIFGAAIMCRIRKVKFIPMLDLICGGLLIGQAVGRWGNFVNIEVFGSNTTAKWGMTSPSIVWYLEQNATNLAKLGVSVDPTLPVHPTFFYESIWCVLGFILIALLTKHRRFDGQLWLTYLAWYGAGRFFIEGLRTDSLLVGTIRVSQLLSLLCVIVSICALIMVFSVIRRANDKKFLPLFANTPDGIAISAGTFYEKKPDKKQTDIADSPENIQPEDDLPASDKDQQE